jgi:hypothetical protein
LKVPHIDGQQLRDAVNVHARCQTGVVYLRASNLMRHKKPPPAVMHVAAVRQKLKITFDHAGNAIRFGGVQPETVLIQLAGGSVPELAKGLRGETEPRALRHEGEKRAANHWVVGIVSFAHPQQDVGVEQARGLRHQS